MTREEAIEFGNMWLQINEDCKDSSTYAFFQMAIKALEQELCEDAISRQAYIERFRKWGYSEFGRKMDNGALAIRVAMSLPPVNPQKLTDKCKWIKYDHRTMCPKEHIDVDSPYWRIAENRMETLKYCPYCGKEIEVEE